MKKNKFYNTVELCDDITLDVPNDKLVIVENDISYNVAKELNDRDDEINAYKSTSINTDIISMKIEGTSASGTVMDNLGPYQVDGFNADDPRVFYLSISQTSQTTWSSDAQINLYCLDKADRNTLEYYIEILQPKTEEMEESKITIGPISFNMSGNKSHFNGRNPDDYTMKVTVQQEIYQATLCQLSEDKKELKFFDPDRVLEATGTYDVLPSIYFEYDWDDVDIYTKVSLQTLEFWCGWNIINNHYKDLQSPSAQVISGSQVYYKYLIASFTHNFRQSGSRPIKAVFYGNHEIKDESGKTLDPYIQFQNKVYWNSNTGITTMSGLTDIDTASFVPFIEEITNVNKK